MRLLMAACHIGPDPPAAPEGEIDATRLVRLAAFHRVSAFAWEARDRLPIPSAALPPLRAAMLATLQRNLQAAAELKIALRALAGASVPVILLKGAHLMDAVYDSPAHRPLSDIDLLIRRRDLPAALATFEALGYSAGARKARFSLAADREIRLMKTDTHEVALDVHTDLNRPTRHHWFPLEDDWARSVPYGFEGEAARALAPADNLAFLCAHAVPHAFAQLIWLCDIARLWMRTPVPAEDLAATAQTARTVRAVGAGLEMAASVLGAPVEPGVMKALGAGAGLRPDISDPARLFAGTSYSSWTSLRWRMALADSRADAGSILLASLRRKAGEMRRGLVPRKQNGVQG
jgi:hypothetical protein